MSRKRYFLEIVIEEDDDVWCAFLPTIKEEMKERGLTEAKVFEAKRCKANDEFFYCEDILGWAEKGECGRFCDSYSPRNGKNGCCKYLSYGYDPTDKSRIIELKI